MRLRWHSPLPPTRSGVADLTALMRPLLVRAFDITFHDGFNIAESPKSAERADSLLSPVLDLYHLGNDLRYHEPIFRLASQRPGVVVFHDANMTEFFSEMLRGGDLDGSGLLQREELRIAGQMLKSGLHGVDYAGGPQSYSLILRLALGNALGAIGFSDEICDTLRVADLCQVYKAELPTTAPRMRSIRAEAGRMVLFGHLGRNRRVFQILLALATHPRRDMLRLDIFGSHADEAGLQEQISDFGLRKHVEYHGYAPDHELDMAIARAVLCVNLRFPTMGEASASQLRVWGLGRTSVVTPSAWYDAAPDGLVLTAPVDREQKALQDAFSLTLDDPGGLIARGEAARRHVLRIHRPAGFLRLLHQVVADREACSVRWRVERYAGRSAEAAAPWRTALSDDHFARAATTIQELSGCRPGTVRPRSP